MLYKKGLMIFRRDLRIHDNTALNKAHDACESIIPCFIFDPRQIGTNNEYKSTNAIQFMIESLEDLADEIEKKDGKLFLFHGHADTVLEKLIKEVKPDAVYCNKDYTPFSINRDEALKAICIKHGIEFITSEDAMLNEPEVVKTINQSNYTVFTPYWRRAREIPVRPTYSPLSFSFYQGSIKGADKELLKSVCPQKNPLIAEHGGRTLAKKILNTIEKFEGYSETRDIPSLLTTRLSAHNKFGTISIREVHEAFAKKLGVNHALIRQLYWRDFYMQVAYFTPFVYGQPFHEKYRDIAWSKSTKNFERWCSGTTGFPIVDAAMRELNATGFMHNRCRMIVASFLTKDLHINWLWGEKYFAQQLVDYDPAVNNGNWQWSASTGCDPQPYFRIFNPWLQQAKFDPECTYIKKWVPELKNYSSKDIHNLYKENSPKIPGYPQPMVEHKKEAAEAIAAYKKAASS